MFRFLDGLRVRKPDAVADAEHMRIHRDRGHVKRAGEHHVRGFPADARQRRERFHGIGHPAAVAEQNQPARFHDVARLAFKPAAADDGKHVVHVRCGQGVNVRVFRKQNRSHLVHLHVRALRGEHHGDQRFVRVFKMQFRPGVRVKLFENPKNGPDVLFLHTYLKRSFCGLFPAGISAKIGIRWTRSPACAANLRADASQSRPNLPYRY